MTRLYLVRHGETTGNSAGRFQGSTDCPLSDLGRAQLEPLAERFRSIPLSAVYSSPLCRAKDTADAINRYHGLPVTILPQVAEIHCGDWEERSWDELEELFGSELTVWRNHPELFAAPNGETMQQVYDRMTAALSSLAHKHQGQSFAVASHGCAIRNFLCWAHGYPFDRLNELPWVINTSVSCVDFDETGAPALVYENDFSHLPQDLLSPRIREKLNEQREEALIQ